MNNNIRRTMLRNNEPVMLFPTGVSMRPLFKQGKTCVGLVPLTQEPQIGDIVAFIRESDDANIIHRLIAIDGDTYITRGDNCLGCERSRRGQLFGVVEWIRTGSKTLYTTDPRYLRYVRFWTQTWPLRRRAYQLRGVWFRMRSAAGRTWLGGKIKQHRRKAG